jgi:DNA-binding MarR family transcriptional regulator
MPEIVTPIPAAVPDAAPSPERLTAAIEVFEQLQELLGFAPRLLGAIEQLTGLRLGQLRLLHAIATQPGGVDELAARIGEHPDAARATVATLATAGMVTVEPAATAVDGRDDLVAATATGRRATADAETITLTESGRARVDQLTALQLRHTAEREDPPSGAERSVLTLVRSLHPGS